MQTGKVQVFDSHLLTADMVMASACLPNIFKSVMIDDVAYWDGGYIGNLALFPFHAGTDTGDIVVVQINPIERKGVPRTAQEIQNRVNEISFKSSLLKELRAIYFVARLIEEGKPPRRITVGDSFIMRPGHTYIWKVIKPTKKIFVIREDV